MQKIVLAGGCFWGVEAYFQKLDGVLETRVGYTDGETEFPTYQDVCASSGHVEAVEVFFEETVISFTKILEHFFRIIDPTSVNRQADDEGAQYRTGIYYHKKEQKLIIQDYIKKEQAKYDLPIVVEVKPETSFYDAEDYHQNYLNNNPTGYCHVNFGLIKEDELKPRLRG